MLYLIIPFCTDHCMPSCLGPPVQMMGRDGYELELMLTCDECLDRIGGKGNLKQGHHYA